MKLVKLKCTNGQEEGHGYSYGLGGWTGQGKKFLFDDGIYIVESVTQWMEIPE